MQMNSPYFLYVVIIIITVLEIDKIAVLKILNTKQTTYRLNNMGKQYG